ncbi:MFS transporter [Acidiferrobacter sp. SPIII_3]|jgi:PPP family 3-phenylpropionic acid transporter|uniref:MFS transporter n=1 Tax=Acidiferrobacter sp. SPIII_3 TaxID=1281578 RepID=UPI00351A96F4
MSLSHHHPRNDWPRSAFYACYFSALGVLLPYWPLYLRQRGFGPRALGDLMALLALSRVVAPYVGGALSDRLGHRMTAVRGAAVLAFACFLTIPYAHGFAAMAAVMMAFSFFWYATLPPVEASTLAFHGDRYGRIRLWGSIGFIIAVLGLGPVLDRFGAATVVPVIAMLLFGLWLTTLGLAPLTPPAATGARPPIQPGLLPFLAACFLMQVSYGPYYTFYSLYLAHYGYSKAAIGALWALGVICEVLVFWQAGRFFAHFRESRLLAFTFALAIVRWILIALFPRSWPLLALAQTFHAFTFGLYHAVAVRLVSRFAGPGAKARAQAIYGTAAGAGAAAGAAMSGYLWVALGREGMFLAAAAVAAVGFAIIARHQIAPVEPAV